MTSNTFWLGISQIGQAEISGLVKPKLEPAMPETMPDLTPSEKRVADTLAAKGYPGTINYLDVPTTTAQQAADATGTDVGQIVKSLIFEGADTGEPWLILVSGANRVHEKRCGRIPRRKASALRCRLCAYQNWLCHWWCLAPRRNRAFAHRN